MKLPLQEILAFCEQKGPKNGRSHEQQDEPNCGLGVRNAVDADRDPDHGDRRLAAGAGGKGSCVNESAV